MKNTILFFCLLLPFSYLSQDLTDKMGAITTNYMFTTDTDTMVVSRQIIVERAGIYLNDKKDERVAGGYRSYRLEIMTETDISLIGVRSRDGRVGFYNLACYDEQDSLLGMFPLSRNEVVRVFKERALFNYKTDNKFFSFDLRTIPLLVLDQTKRIDIVR